MVYNYESHEEIILIAVFIAFILLLVIIAFYYNKFKPFLKTREYIKMEIQRADEDDEYIFWKNELKRLYKKSIPFIGRFFK